MERKRDTTGNRSSISPLPELPPDEAHQRNCSVRLSRATSEARSDCAANGLLRHDGDGSPVRLSSMEVAGSGEGSVHLRDESERRLSSNQSPRASSEAFQKRRDPHRDPYDEPNTVGIAANPSSTVQVSSSRYGTRCPKVSPNSTQKKKLTPPAVTNSPQYMQQVLQFNPRRNVLEHIRWCEWKLHHTVKGGTEAFRYSLRLDYPLEDSSSISHTAEEEESVNTITPPISPAGGGVFPVASGSRDPATQPFRGSSHDLPEFVGGGQSVSIPSLDFRKTTFSTCLNVQEKFLLGSDSTPKRAFSDPFDLEEPDPPSVTALAMTVLQDPLNGAPVLGMCLGDYDGHIEYFELLVNSSKDKKGVQNTSNAHSSRELCQSGYTSVQHHKNSSDAVNTTYFVGAEATVSDARTAWRNKMVRRHRHKPYIKSINALTSVAVEPCVKCLTFVNPSGSPNRITYLTANERVIKLFHVRREGIGVLQAFPHMSTVLGESSLGSRYSARTHGQASILPSKEYGPLANSIQALSVSADCETFMSVEDLQVFWWHFEASDTTKPICIVDLRPCSGVLDEIEELITSSSFHPTHGSLFLLSRSSGILNVGDLRDPPSRDARRYALTTQITPAHNPFRCPAYDEILCSISAASFLGPHHLVTRDYLSLKLWDVRQMTGPCASAPVMAHAAPYLDVLYRHDSIFDRFPLAADGVSGTVVTGLYDGAVAVWQPGRPDAPPPPPAGESEGQRGVEKGANGGEEGGGGGGGGKGAAAYYRVEPGDAPGGTARGRRLEASALSVNLAAAMAAAARGADEEANGEGPQQGEEGPRRTSDSEGLEGSEMGLDPLPEPFTNKVLNVAITPGGERFGYTYKNGRLVYIFERVGKASNKG